jgi:hypothetical protein
MFCFTILRHRVGTYLWIMHAGRQGDGLQEIGDVTSIEMGADTTTLMPIRPLVTDTYFQA